MPLKLAVLAAHDGRFLAVARPWGLRTLSAPSTSGSSMGQSLLCPIFSSHALGLTLLPANGIDEETTLKEQFVAHALGNLLPPGCSGRPQSMLRWGIPWRNCYLGTVPRARTRASATAGKFLRTYPAIECTAIGKASGKWLF